MICFSRLTVILEYNEINLQLQDDNLRRQQQNQLCQFFFKQKKRYTSLLSQFWISKNFSAYSENILCPLSLNPFVKNTETADVQIKK